MHNCSADLDVLESFDQLHRFDDTIRAARLKERLQFVRRPSRSILHLEPDQDTLQRVEVVVDVRVEKFTRCEVAGVAGSGESGQGQANEGVVEREVGVVAGRVGVLVVVLVLPVRVHPGDVCNKNVGRYIDSAFIRQK